MSKWFFWIGNLALLSGIGVIIYLQTNINDGEPNKDLPTTTMQIGQLKFTLEIARTELTRDKGLMFRKSMPEDHGMIFVFSRERDLSFWMKNVEFPLDILFLDARGKVVSIKHMKAHDVTGVASDKPAQYAIELNEGMAAKARVQIGDDLTIPDDAKAK